MAEMVNNTKSVDPLTHNGTSTISWLYVIHKEEDTIFNRENIKE